MSCPNCALELAPGLTTCPRCMNPVSSAPGQEAAPAPGYAPYPLPGQAQQPGMGYPQPGMGYPVVPRVPDVALPDSGPGSLASPISRALAYVIDALLLGVPFALLGVGVFYAFFGAISDVNSLEGGLGAIFGGILLLFLLVGLFTLAQGLYYTLTQARPAGATLGKKVMGIKVIVLAGGAHMSKGRSLGRWASQAALTFTFSSAASVGSSVIEGAANLALDSTDSGVVLVLLALLTLAITLPVTYGWALWAFFDARRQGLHDKICSTVVVRSR